jgi:hypothetical protein
MKLSLVAVLLVSAAVLAAASTASNEVNVEIHTSKGTIRAILFKDKAPITVKTRRYESCFCLLQNERSRSCDVTAHAPSHDVRLTTSSTTSTPATTTGLSSTA